MKEEWRDVPGYNGYYQASSLGRLRIPKNRYGKEQFIKGSLNSNKKYLRTRLKNPCKDHYIHRLVALTFLGKPTKERYDVNHKDGNGLNNIVSNLEYCSKFENNQHAIKNNLLTCKSATGYKFIYFRDDVSVSKFQFKRIYKGRTYQRYFKTLEEAVDFRDRTNRGLENERKTLKD